MDANIVVNSRDCVGESPRWDRWRRRLWWVDAEQASVHWYDPSSGGVRTEVLPANATSIAIGHEALMATFPDGLYRIAPDSFKVDLVLRVRPGEGSMFNDSGCDRKGRLWVGSGSEEAGGLGRLMVFDPDAGTVTTVLDGLWLPNGIALEPGRHRNVPGRQLPPDCRELRI